MLYLLIVFWKWSVNVSGRIKKTLNGLHLFDTIIITSIIYQVYQNHLMIGSWVLLCGLHHALAGAPCPTTTPGKSPAKTSSRPYNLTKMYVQIQHFLFIVISSSAHSIFTENWKVLSIKTFFNFYDNCTKTPLSLEFTIIFICKHYITLNS